MGAGPLVSLFFGTFSTARKMNLLVDLVTVAGAERRRPVEVVGRDDLVDDGRPPGRSCPPERQGTHPGA